MTGSKLIPSKIEFLLIGTKLSEKYSYSNFKVYDPEDSVLVPDGVFC